METSGLGLALKIKKTKTITGDHGKPGTGKKKNAQAVTGNAKTSALVRGCANTDVARESLTLHLSQQNRREVKKKRGHAGAGKKRGSERQKHTHLDTSADLHGNARLSWGKARNCVQPSDQPGGVCGRLPTNNRDRKERKEGKKNGSQGEEGGGAYRMWSRVARTK